LEPPPAFREKAYRNRVKESRKVKETGTPPAFREKAYRNRVKESRKVKETGTPGLQGKGVKETGSSGVSPTCTFTKYKEEKQGLPQPGYILKPVSPPAARTIFHSCDLFFFSLKNPFSAFSLTALIFLPRFFDQAKKRERHLN
jgi:hypothetical protein